MRGAVEALAFGTLALGLHLVVFAAAPVTRGGSAAGEGGEATVSLQGAPAGLAALVDRWTTAPEPDSAPAMAPQAAPDMAPPDRPAPSGGAALPRRGPAPLPVPSDAALPAQVRTTPPPPPVTARAPERAARPPARAEASRTAPRQSRQTPERAAPPAAAPTRKAAGTGAGAVAGESGRTAEPGLSPAQTRSLVAQWGGGIRAAVERRLRYPGGTSASGTARIALSVSTGGRLGGARLTGSTGDAALDRAAIAAVRGARYPRAPRGLPAGTYRFTVPLTLRP